MDESGVEGDLVLIQTFLHYVIKVFLRQIVFFKNNFHNKSKEGMYQNKVNFSLASIHNCKMGYLLNVGNFFLELNSCAQYPNSEMRRGTESAKRAKSAD